MGLYVDVAADSKAAKAGSKGQPLCGHNAGNDHNEGNP